MHSVIEAVEAGQAGQAGQARCTLSVRWGALRVIGLTSGPLSMWLCKQQEPNDLRSRPPSPMLCDGDGNSKGKLGILVLGCDGKATYYLSEIALVKYYLMTDTMCMRSTTNHLTGAETMTETQREDLERRAEISERLAEELTGELADLHRAGAARAREELRK